MQFPVLSQCNGGSNDKIVGRWEIENSAGFTETLRLNINVMFGRIGRWLMCGWFHEGFGCGMLRLVTRTGKFRKTLAPFV